MDWIVPVMFVIAFACGIPYALKYERRSLDAFLEPSLRAHGLSLVSSRPRRLFEKAPFPRVRVRVTFINTHWFGKRGEQDHVRVVTVRDSGGCLHIVWARVLLTAFMLRDIEWRPSLGTLGDCPEPREEHARDG